jgi:hypothetical protein
LSVHRTITTRERKERKKERKKEKEKEAATLSTQNAQHVDLDAAIR